MATTFTLDDLLARIPPELEPFRPVVVQYGPALVKMTADEFMAWLTMLIQGNTDAAWAAVMKNLPDDAAILNAWDKVNDKWQAANEANKAKMELQKAAAMAFLKVLLAVALAAAGL